MKESLKAKLISLPMEPGCYLMKDNNGRIIYIGKAKKLKNRVNQYFVGVHDFKTTKMVSLVADFDYIITDSEKDALILEFNLIKKHKPKYNIMFIDDKTYPYIKLTNEKYPVLSVVRDIKKDKKSKYFGPFPDAKAAYSTVKVLQDLYPLRRCKILPKKVCLYYHLNQCLGPCEYKIDQSVYEEMANKIIKFLKGNVKGIIDELTNKMLTASDRLDFEKAKEYADDIKAINHVVSSIEVEKNDGKDKDVFACYSDKGYLAIQGFLVRMGKVIEREFKLSPLYGDVNEEFISFLGQYYQNHLLPKELVIESSIDTEGLSEALGLKIVKPVKGYRKKLIDMCKNNARKQLEQNFAVVERKASDLKKANNELNKLLNHNIHRIEIFDNSHTSGYFSVSAMAVYEDGEPFKKDYRLYKLHTANNDLESMKEVVYRRYYRVLMEGLKKCDLILVDGGINQIKAAKKIITDLKMEMMVLGLVKDEHHSTRSLMNEEGYEYKIDKDSALFFLLTRMQDDVHNLAVNYHRKLRSKAQTVSILDEIEGVGNVRKKQLLNHFKNFKGIKEATIEQLAEIVPMKTALSIYGFLHDDDVR